jgi:PAS domain S-box-containing protein
VRSLAFPVQKDGKVTSLDGMLQDITDIIEMQTGMNRALRSLDNQRYVLDQHAIVAVTDVTGRITRVNRLFTELAGYSQEELVGRSHNLLKSGVHAPEFFDELWKTVTGGKVWQGEICNRARDGSQFWLHTTVVPLRGEDGDIEEFVSVSANITRLKHTEATLRRAHKMEAIGQLSGGIAHDFNNLLGIVIGNIELAELQLPLAHDARLTLQNARNAAMRGSVLTRRLLNFSRQAPVAGPLLDVNLVLSGLEVLISKSLTAMVRVEMQLDRTIGKVQVPAGDLEDAIINLAINAGDAMPEGGSLYFTTHRLVLTRPELCNNIELSAGEWVELTIIDTGVGMTADTMEKIFEPYYTTKTGNKGTGLGLSMVYGFVQRSSGHITVVSSPGKGTSFSIFLPVVVNSDQRVEDAASRAGIPMVAKPGETILLVDDEEEIVNVTSSHLRNLGYTVLGCTGAEAALDWLNGSERIDLLFTDIVMPGGINGIDLAERGLRLRPELKVLLTTGYARVKDRKIMEHWNDRLLAKPYGSAELSRRLREMLDA